MISVIAPAYNVGEKIATTMHDLKNSIEELSDDYEILVVDDGSTDSTYTTAKELEQQSGNGFRVLTYSKNMGKGHALKYGFERARGDLIFFIDADGDLPPRQMKSYLETMEKQGADAVVGSKKHAESRVVNYPQNRRILSFIYHLIIRTLFKLNVKDTQVGMKLFKREAIEEVMPATLVKKYAFDIEILANIVRRGYKVVDAPVELEFENDSRINGAAIWYMFIDTMAVAYRLHILKHYDHNNSNGNISSIPIGLKDVNDSAQIINPTPVDRILTAGDEMTTYGVGHGLTN